MLMMIWTQLAARRWSPESCCLPRDLLALIGGCLARWLPHWRAAFQHFSCRAARLSERLPPIPASYRAPVFPFLAPPHGHITRRLPRKHEKKYLQGRHRGMQNTVVYFRDNTSSKTNRIGRTVKVNMLAKVLAIDKSHQPSS